MPTWIPFDLRFSSSRGSAIMISGGDVAQDLCAALVFQAMTMKLLAGEKKISASTYGYMSWRAHGSTWLFLVQTRLARGSAWKKNRWSGGTVLGEPKFCQTLAQNAWERAARAGNCKSALKIFLSVGLNPHRLPGQRLLGCVLFSIRRGQAENEY